MRLWANIRIAFGTVLSAVHDISGLERVSHSILEHAQSTLKRHKHKIHPTNTWTKKNQVGKIQTCVGKSWGKTREKKNNSRIGGNAQFCVIKYRIRSGESTATALYCVSTPMVKHPNGKFVRLSLQRSFAPYRSEIFVYPQSSVTKHGTIKIHF